MKENISYVREDSHDFGLSVLMCVFRLQYLERSKQYRRKLLLRRFHLNLMVTLEQWDFVKRLER